ncbi:MAG TPA: hypothetical protein VF719_02195, partial [Abditibacteriaceae bacterium]
LEDGLVQRTPQGWKHFGTPQISTPAPRQLVVFGGALYVRHGGGQVDRFDGKTWVRDVFRFVPRRKTLCIAAGAGRIYLGQWGGWSEWDGRTWTHYFDVESLRGVPLMSLLPEGDNLWVGTQSKGVARLSQATTNSVGPKPEKPQLTIQWQDERNGIPDEWITCLAQSGGAVYAGTFVGGLARFAPSKWLTFVALNGKNVTALEPHGKDGVWIATRDGVWHQRGNEPPAALVATPLDSEVQALYLAGNHLWVGTRTGLYRVALAK